MIMDSVDIFLAAAKLLKYSGYNNACDYMFVFFMVSWVVLRHGLYNYLFYQSWHNASSLMSNSECIPGQFQKRCWTPTILNSFFFLLGGLQVITMIWMYLISKVAYKVILGKGAEDVRSDEDDLDYEEDSNIAPDGHHSSNKRRDYPNIGSDINIK
jgi:acyl-CoA-dependent ceramide synthase